MLLQPPTASTIIWVLLNLLTICHCQPLLVASLGNRQIDAANVSIIRRAAVEHNKSSCLSIHCEATGDYFSIPFCEVDRNAVINGRKKIKTWWSRYGYGLRVGMQIYCTVNRRDVNVFRALFQNKGGVSSSFLLHLSSQSNLGHKVDELKRK
jgi:hypothetical protein